MQILTSLLTLIVLAVAPLTTAFLAWALLRAPIAPQETKSNLAVVGRYLLTPRIFAKLETTGRGKGGEIQLTDAIAELARRAQVDAYHFEGTRFDCGSHLGLIEATIRFALDHETLSEKARAAMRAALDEMGVREH